MRLRGFVSEELTSDSFKSAGRRRTTQTCPGQWLRYVYSNIRNQIHHAFLKSRDTTGTEGRRERRPSDGTHIFMSKTNRARTENIQQEKQMSLREWDKIDLDEDGILHRKTVVRKQLVLSGNYKSTVLKELHDEMGHQGVDLTTSLIQDRFFCPYMQREIEHHDKLHLPETEKNLSVKQKHH